MLFRQASARFCNQVLCTTKGAELDAPFILLPRAESPQENQVLKNRPRPGLRLSRSSRFATKGGYRGFRGRQTYLRFRCEQYVSTAVSPLDRNPVRRYSVGYDPRSIEPVNACSGTHPLCPGTHFSGPPLEERRYPRYRVNIRHIYELRILNVYGYDLYA